MWHILIYMYIAITIPHLTLITELSTGDSGSAKAENKNVTPILIIPILVIPLLVIPTLVIPILVIPILVIPILGWILIKLCFYNI